MNTNDEALDVKDFLEFDILIAFPRSRKIYCERKNHLLDWSDFEFVNQFRLSKNSTNFMLSLIEDRISCISLSPYWYVIYAS